MIIDIDRNGGFELDAEFLEPFRRRPVRWGFGALSWATFQRSYSREGEAWWQTCRRVIEGMYTVQRIHCLDQRRPWDEAKAQRSAREAYTRLWQFKWTPPGRGLWSMGTRHVYERGGAALNNCGFISTRTLDEDYAKPFVWMLQMSMLGVGVGFDTHGKGKVTLQPPRHVQESHVIEDSREGWAAALARLLVAYVGGADLPARWDVSQIRPQGSPLRSFGGVSSGPGPLQLMLATLQELHDAYVGRKIDARLIVDAMNIIGRCVVAGGIRRSAQIAFGDPDDTLFLDLKQNRQKVMAYRWASNNSVFATTGMDYTDIARRTVVNGEPGFFWLDRARAHGRMKDPPDWADARAEGSNPCVEQTLWDKELCCLVETFPAHHDSLEDYQRTVRLAYLYAKTATLVPTEDPETNAVMQQNRRIGCSMTGIVQAINRVGYERFLQWCDEAYQLIQPLDRACSDWLAVPRSIKTTSVKPSGTVSLLAGATPGVHWEHAPYYIRRVRVQEHHPLVEMCRRAGYHTEPDLYSANTTVISFPVHIPGCSRGKAEVPLQEKVRLAADLQHVWSDNQVSCTAEFDPDHEGGEVVPLLSEYEKRLKAIVFLPALRHGYEQAPYETLTRPQYEAMTRGLKPLEGSLPHEQELEERFCEGGICDVPLS